MGRRTAGGRSGVSLLSRGRRRLRRPLPLALCIDVEPDEREVDPSAPSWRGFERLLEREDELRGRAGRLVTGPPILNWFVRCDPQIAAVHGKPEWALDHYAESWERLRAAGDEIGIHPHAWRDDGRGWVADHGDDAWVESCYALSIEAYERHFGRAPRISRGGDRFINQRTVALLERHGLAADLTVEPRMPAAASVGDEARTTGSLPDYTHAPEHAYHPAASDFLRPASGEMRLTMLPLTAGGPEVLYPWMDAHQFSQRLNERLAAGNCTHLAFAIRSSLALDDDAWERALTNLERVPHIVATSYERRVVMSTASALAAAVR